MIQILLFSQNNNNDNRTRIKKRSDGENNWEKNKQRQQKCGIKHNEAVYDLIQDYN